MVVTFCGHKDITNEEILKKAISDTVEKLINDGATEFLFGGYGNFDMLCAKTVKELKNQYAHIKSVIVIPYIDKFYDKNLYDYSEYPPIENVPKKFAIVKRNEHMVDKSDVIIAYVNHNFGGAYNTLKYAQRREKEIIRI